jgi:hypothetical protein
VDTISVQIENGKISILEYPTAARVIVLEGAKAKRIADLFLHRVDLLFSLDCITAITNIQQENFKNEVFWRCAIVHYFKCFGDSISRFSLNSNKIYRHHGPVAMEVFQFFKSLRDEHYVHDQNSCLSAMPLAVVASEQEDYKIAKIAVPAFRASMLTVEEFNNLANLISEALRWVEEQFDLVAERLTSELELLSREQLMAMKEAEYENPTLAEAFLTR